MERSKLKLAVIFLLAALDLCLLGIVVWQDHSARSYETAAMEQAMLYLENHGIRARRETIPWETSLDVPVKSLPEHILIQRRDENRNVFPLHTKPRFCPFGITEGEAACLARRQGVRR